MSNNSLSLINIETSILFVCDVQEKFRPSISHFNEIVTVIQRLIKACNILDIKIVGTEQYPKGLGHTIEELSIVENKIKVFEKKVFSMLTDDIKNEIGKEVKTVILCGLETHICVLQTTKELLQNGYEVIIIADGVSSRTIGDKKIALRHLEKIGAQVRTSESILFELIKTADHPKFREIQKIILTPAPDTGLSHI
uniref:Isochorismatase domain-containing protein n=1 Tax=Strongyloides venezuelensis TaxID=75913 RepID=A0A0K0F5H6_STRVS